MSLPKGSGSRGFATGAVRALLGYATRAFVRPYRARRPPSKRVAIVVPLSSPPALHPDEVTSLRHLNHFLPAYDRYVVAPQGEPVHHEGFTTLYFPPKFFGSAAAYNILASSPAFYAPFEDYEYILIHHLDSLVLGDRLTEWCDAGFDYIGAPWLPCPDTPWVREAGVGNGGFTLMRVSATLHVLYNRYRQDPMTYWSETLLHHERRLRPLRRFLEYFERRFPDFPLIAWPLRQWRVGSDPGVHGANNDYLWSSDAPRFVPGFTVAPVREALRFAFEASPRHCFELNNRALPFGCHAWAKFDREFWTPYLLPEEGERDVPADANGLRGPARAGVSS